MSNTEFLDMIGTRLTKGYDLDPSEALRLLSLARKGEQTPQPINDPLARRIARDKVQAIRDAMTRPQQPDSHQKKFVADWQPKEPRAPIYLNFAMNIMFNPALAKERLGKEHWNSPAGAQVRHWLVQQELATVNHVYDRYPQKIGGSVNVWRSSNYEITDKGRAWIEHACGTPLPKREVVSVKEEIRWVRG